MTDLEKIAFDTGNDINRALSGAEVIPEESLDERLDDIEGDLRNIVVGLYALHRKNWDAYLKAQSKYTAFLRLRNDSVPMTTVDEPAKGE